MHCFRETETQLLLHIFRIVFVVFYIERETNDQMFFLLIFFHLSSIKFVTIAICDCDRLSPSFTVNVILNHEYVYAMHACAYMRVEL